MSSKKKKTTRKHPNIVDILRARKENKKQQDKSHMCVEIDPSLMEKSDILCDENYQLSPIAIKWFSENSNIDQVIDSYVEYVKKENPVKSLLIESMIRNVMDIKFRIHYPYNSFKFNTLHCEVIAKELLMHPAIKTESDLKRVTEFYDASQLKSCSINMAINNTFHSDITTIIESKRKKYGSRNLVFYNRTGMNRILRKFYESKDMVEYIDLQTITFEEICEISNFKERAMKNADLDERQFYNYYGEAYLDLYRTSPEIRFSDKKFLVNPRYYLISNYISEDQEALIIRDMRTFFRKTNAMAILRQNREEYSKDLEPTLTKEEISLAVRNRIYMHYMRMPKRNMPPFHDLYIYQEFIKKHQQENLNPEITSQPHDIVSKPNTPSKLAYRQRQVCEKNPDPQENFATSSGSSSNSRATVIDRFIHKMAMTVQDFFRVPDASIAEMDLITILAASPTLLKPVGDIISTQFPDDFEIIWSVENKRISFLNTLLYLLRKSPETLEKIINSTLTDKLKTDALKKLNDLTVPCNQDNQDNWTPPLITSTQNPDQQQKNLPENIFDTIEENLVIAEEVVIEKHNVLLPLDNANVDPILIKREPLPQYTPNQNYGIDSDVQILSLSDDHVIVIDSDTEDDSIVTALEKDNEGYNLGHDRYQLQLNAESQQATSDEQIPVITSPAAQPRQSILSQNHSLANYDLRIHQLEMGDRQKAGSGKRKNREQVRDQPKKKLKQNAGTMFYIDSEEQELSHKAEVAQRQIITFKSPAKSYSLDNGASCYIIELQRMTFKRDLIFEISIHLPQFACYDVQIKGDNIKNALNLNDIEWQTLVDNLYTIGEYEYIHGHSSKISHCGISLSIVRQLDLYFSSLSQIKSFQVISNGHIFSTAPSSSIPSNLQTFNAIDPDILNLMCVERNNN